MSSKLHSLAPHKLSKITDLIGIDKKVNSSNGCIDILSSLDKNRFLAEKGREELKAELRQIFEERTYSYIRREGAEFLTLILMTREVKIPYLCVNFLEMALNEVENLDELILYLDECDKLKASSKLEGYARENDRIDRLIVTARAREKAMREALVRELP